MEKPIDDIPIDEEWLKTLYDILIEIYSTTERPIVSGFPLVLDYDYGLLSSCVERPRTTINGKAIYPHVLQRAAVLMHSIIVFHPFVDGNKRTALLATNFYLHWNGYKLVLPKDADEFTVSVAKGDLELKDVFWWVARHTKRTPETVVRHWFCRLDMSVFDIATLPIHQRGKALSSRTFLVPLEAIRFFGAKIHEERVRRRTQSAKTNKPSNEVTD
jgi:death-on-curing protein